METCPTCKTGFIGQRKGTKGIFWGCSNHPQCKSNFPDKDGSPDLTAKQKRPAVISKTHFCPKCNVGLVRRTGKKKIKGKTSYFWGCSTVPECEITMLDKRGKPNFETVKDTAEEVTETKDTVDTETV